MKTQLIKIEIDNAVHELSLMMSAYLCDECEDKPTWGELKKKEIALNELIKRKKEGAGCLQK